MPLDSSILGWMTFWFESTHASAWGEHSESTEMRRFNRNALSGFALTSFLMRLVRSESRSRPRLQQAEKILDFDVLKLCMEGPEAVRLMLRALGSLGSLGSRRQGLL